MASPNNTDFIVHPRPSIRPWLISIATLTAIILLRQFFPRAEPSTHDIDIETISAFTLPVQATLNDIPPSVRSLDGKRVRFDTKAWQTIARPDGPISSFIAVSQARSLDEHTVPLAQQIWDCQVPPGIKAGEDIEGNLLRVTGVLHIAFEFDPQNAKLMRVFHVNVEHVKIIEAN